MITLQFIWSEIVKLKRKVAYAILLAKGASTAGGAFGGDITNPTVITSDRYSEVGANKIYLEGSPGNRVMIYPEGAFRTQNPGGGGMDIYIDKPLGYQLSNAYPGMTFNEGTMDGPSVQRAVMGMDWKFSKIGFDMKPGMLEFSVESNGSAWAHFLYVGRLTLGTLSYDDDGVNRLQLNGAGGSGTARLGGGLIVGKALYTDAVKPVSALAEFVSTTQGVLFPNMTTTQRDAIASPVAGLLVYDTTAGKFSSRGASSWGYFTDTAANSFTGIQTLSGNALGVTPTDRLIVSNTTAAAVGAQQISPSLRFTGQGWKTNATAGSQAVDFINYLLPVQGAANPSSTLTWDASINGGAFANAMTLTSAGALSTAGTISSASTITGTQFIGALTTTATVANANFTASSGGGINSATTTQLLFSGATTIYYRVAERGSTGGVLTAGTGYASHIIGEHTFTEATSGAHPMASQLVIKPLVITNDATATTTNAATVYITGAMTGVTATGRNDALKVTGNGLFDNDVTVTGILTVATAAAATNTTQAASTAHVFAERTNTATLTNKTLTDPSITEQTTTPSAPTAASKLYSRPIASRNMLAQVPVTGYAYPVQPLLGMVRTALSVVRSGNAVPSDLGLGTTITAAATTTAVVNPATWFGSLHRISLASAGTAGATAIWRSTTAVFFLGNGTAPGGFFATFHAGMGTVVAQNRAFVGMYVASDTVPNTNPSTWLNCVGFGYDSTQTTWRVMSGDGTTAMTPVDLGANFPIGSASDWYQFVLYAPPSQSTIVYYYVKRANTGHEASGSITTNLPVAATLLFSQISANNGSTASLTSINVGLMGAEIQY